MMNKKIISIFEIAILVMASIAISYLIGKTNLLDNDINNKESKFTIILRNLLISWLGKNLVSAEEVQGLWTCPKNKQGSFCQEYISTQCAANCDTECILTRRENTKECELGTCIDSSEGTCAQGTPKKICGEQQGLLWDERTVQEIPACRPGCCVIGTQTSFVNSMQCDVLRDKLGVNAEFKPEITNELACIALANPNVEGACLLEEVEFGKRACKRTTKENCQKLAGDFRQGFLCSNNKALNSTCTAQARTGCFGDKDEVYWFDSCGNVENIYDFIRKNELKDLGKIIGKSESCSLSTKTDPFARQSTCGNCDYITGSKCGTKQPQDKAPASGNYVCRDLSCVDENKKKWKHGESWCAYEGQIGTDGKEGTNEQRSADIVGSEHYKKLCLNGEIRTERCGNARNQICSQSTTEQGEFSSAACRINQWQLCVDANLEDSAEKVKKECGKYTDCYLKSVDLIKGGRGNFAFDICVPRYPPGFNLQDSETAESICGLASINCKYVKTKKLFGGSKKVNKLCREKDYTETMNNLCISLGDCGAKYNVAGEFSDDGYRVNNNDFPELDSDYKSKLKNYLTPKTGQKAPPLNEEELIALFGLPAQIGEPGEEKGMGDILETFGAVSGALGTLAAAGAEAGLFGGISGIISPSSLSLSLGSWASVAAGALIGAAATAYLISLTGIDKGLPTPFTLALVAAGAYAGGAAALGIISSSPAALGGACAFSACIVIVIIVVIIVVLTILGIGKSKKVTVEFQCLPWQPPRGGADCGKCKSEKDDGLPCSKYKCESLGQTCQFVNEGSDEEACVNVAPNDVGAPVISPDKSVLLEGYSYNDVSQNGYRLQGLEKNGCVPVFNQIKIGINTNEYAQCKVENKHTNKFEEMNHYFHASGKIESSSKKLNHTRIFAIPSKETFENEDELTNDPEINPDNEKFEDDFMRPDASGNVNLYVRCSDAAGNANVNEYAINFCVSPEPDRTAPLITQFIPPSPAYVAQTTTNKQVIFYLNEPAECKWSLGDKDYGVMENAASCLNDFADQTPFGWQCNMTLSSPTIEEKEKSHYIRCKDQPFLNESAGEIRNKNAESHNYTLIKTITPLEIVSIKPNGTIFTNGNIASVTLEVETEGGAPESNRYCKYTIRSFSDNFKETGTDLHKQTFSSLIAPASYNFPIRCYDVAGNEDTGNAEFKIEVDNSGPAITRVYDLQGLNVITNENSMCAFSLNSCSFSFANGTLMSGNEKAHSSSFDNGITHYVICKDTFGNLGSCVAVGRGQFA